MLPPSPAGTNVVVTALIADGALALAPGLWRLPLATWPRLASLALMPLVFVLIAVGNIADPNPYAFGLPFVTVFLWLGAAHRRGTAVALARLAAATYVTALMLAPVGVAGMLGSMLAWRRRAQASARPEHAPRRTVR